MGSRAVERGTLSALRGRGARITTAAALLTAVLIAGGFYFAGGRLLLLRPYRDSFSRGDLSGWTFFGGQWTANEGTLDNLSGARGDKAVTGSSRWTDYVVETDLRLNADPADSLWGDAGIIIRVTDASPGVDAYDGYYVGIGSEGSVLLLGRANYSWVRLGSAPLDVRTPRGAWFHLRALARGCEFEVSARRLPDGARTELNYFERNCAKLSGAAGVRTYGLPASWKNFTVHLPD